MAESELVKVKLEDRVYSVLRFNPIDGLEFGLKIMSVLSGSFGGWFEATKEGGDVAKVGAELSKAFLNPELKPLLRTALSQVFTPENKSLSDEAVFNAWFIRHPEDMFDLSVRASWVLVKDFLPKSAVIAIQDLTAKVQAQT
jgi:hypothetical protein